MEQLKRELTERYISTIKECKRLGYPPRYFTDMLISDDDVVEVTRRLVCKEGGTDGYRKLYEMGRLDLTVENIILEPRFRVLFSLEVLQAAYNQLKLCEYDGLSKIEAP